MQKTRWVYQRKLSFPFDPALATQLVNIKKSIKLIMIENPNYYGRAANCHFLWRVKLRSRTLVVLGRSLCTRQECLYLRVSGVSSRIPPQLLASYRLYVSHNTPRSSRRGGSPRSQRLAALLRLLCPRSNWSELHATREPRWRSSLPPRYQQESGRAGGTSWQPSLENRILNKWGVSHLPPGVIFFPFLTTWCVPQLTTFVAEERKARTVYPPADHVFTWTQMCDIRDVSLAAEKPTELSHRCWSEGAI